MSPSLNKAESYTSEFTTETDKPLHQHVQAPNLEAIIEKEGDAVDENAEALRNQDLNFTAAEERAVLRKIDWRLMPIMALTCGLQFVDKAAIGNAAVFGLRTDLNLVGQQYSWAVSIFYFGYLIACWPAIYCMQRWHAGRFIGICTFLWGVCIISTAGCHNFAGLATARFFLGVFEACLSPGFTMITTRWYQQKEQPFRFGLWTITNGVLPIPFLVIYYAIGTSSGGPLAPWRWIFVLLGIVTIFCGVAVYFLVPDSPSKVSWLNDREKAIAVERVARSQTGLKNTKWKWEQCWEALTDIKCWLMVATLFLSQSGGALNTNFLGLVINGFGYSKLRTILLQTPTFAIQTGICLIVTGLVTFTRTFRHYKQPILSIAACLVITGCAIVYTHAPDAANRQLLLGALYMCALNNCSFTTILAVIGINVAGSTKKSTVQAMTFIAYCVANIVIPQAFLQSEAPRYRTGIFTVLVFQIVLVACYWASWSLMRLENRRRDKALANMDEASKQQAEDAAYQMVQGLRDLTDKQNPLFRYSG